MILSDRSLKALIAKGELVIDPFAGTAVQPASIDLRLGNHFLMVDDSVSTPLSLDAPVPYREIKHTPFIIKPHSFLLATTLEYIRLPNGITAFVEGRSSIGRMGLFIQNAGWVDAGFEGKITLELFNANPLPITLQVGRRICQLVFCKMDITAEIPYRGKYFKQTEAVGSKIHQDAEVTTHE